MQTSADHQSRWRHVSRMTDEKGETWSPSGMSKVRSRPESLVADCSVHVLVVRIAVNMSINCVFYMNNE